jgi:hypothetical protein
MRLVLGSIFSALSSYARVGRRALRRVLGIERGQSRSRRRMVNVYDGASPEGFVPEVKEGRLSNDCVDLLAQSRMGEEKSVPRRNRVGPMSRPTASGARRVPSHRREELRPGLPPFEVGTGCLARIH